MIHLKLEILEKLDRDEHYMHYLSMLAAGPLEELIYHHGQKFIGRIESECKQNSKLADALGGVWSNDIEPDVWRKVEQLRSSQW